jgi:hypothetical protein
MRKLLLFAALALAGMSFSFAEAFEGLSFEVELDGVAMASIDGQMLTIIVPFNSQGTATVTNSERYGSKTFTVPVTTVAVSKNPNNPPTDKAGKIYTPIPLPKGTYNLGGAKAMSDATYGTGIKIQATVVTPYKNSPGSFKANDFFVHATPYSSTWGCVGVVGNFAQSASSNMQKVLNAFKNSSGSKIITVR